MFGAIVVMALAPWLDTFFSKVWKIQTSIQMVVCYLVIDFIVLMWCGAMPAEEPYATIALIGSVYWFAYFLIILPILGIIETPDKQPETIEEAVKLAKKRKLLNLLILMVVQFLRSNL